MSEPAALTAAAPAAPPADWRLALEERRRRHLRAWFLSGAALTFLILVIGGITRLTQSGLSMVDWKPIMGVIPPIGHAEWEAAFARYREFPEYQKLRVGMTLGEFQFIFFWEYLHRIAARLIGVVFLVPFLYFWARGYFSRPLLGRALLLFALGALQGLVGWLMVKSGLVDNPHVSHFRLAAHLSVALAILSFCTWLACEMSVRPVQVEARRREGRREVHLLGALLVPQIVWGALVAGLHAGRIYNTFPLMDGRLAPPAWGARSFVQAALENPATVQWVHRLIGTLLLLTAVGVFFSLRAAADAALRRLSAAFLAGVIAQYTLGVLTLLHFVPITLGVLHQAMAVLLLALWVVWLHRASTGPAVVGRQSSVL